MKEEEGGVESVPFYHIVYKYPITTEFTVFHLLSVLKKIINLSVIRLCAERLHFRVNYIHTVFIISTFALS